MISKTKIKKSFSMSAKTYDDYANLQKEICKDIVSRLLAFDINPEKILDIGTGTGNCALSIYENFPFSKVYAFDIARGMIDFMYSKIKKLDRKIYLTEADAQNMPYMDGSFDLIVSNLTYQWVEDIEDAFKEVARIIGNRGVFVFTTLGTNTFRELRESYVESNIKKNSLLPLHSFNNKDNILYLLDKAGFTRRKVDVVSIKKEYNDVRAFLKVLKNIGAGNAHSGVASLGIGKRSSLYNLIDFYQSRFCSDSGIYVTYEIFYVVAFKR